MWVQALRKAAWGQALARISRREEEDRQAIVQVLGPGAGLHSKIYCYSGQALGFKDFASAQMREKLGRTKNSTYTYSQEFNSQVGGEGWGSVGEADITQFVEL